MWFLVRRAECKWLSWRYVYFSHNIIMQLLDSVVLLMPLEPGQLSVYCPFFI